jgi:hypothetical protein
MKATRTSSAAKRSNAWSASRSTRTGTLRPSQATIDEFSAEGYALARELFAPDEVAALRDHYMTMRASGSFKGDYVGVDANADDPLQKYPRLIMMHRWDERSLRWLIDARLWSHVAAFSDGVEPFAVQTMVYFKPAGARGQALHQDQYYLRVKPGTSIAAWRSMNQTKRTAACKSCRGRTHCLCAARFRRTPRRA